MSWTTEALSLWEEEYAEWGVAMLYNGMTLRCIKDPTRVTFGMSQTGYDKQVATVFDVLRTDAIATGIYSTVTQDNPQSKRPVVISAPDGQVFTCLHFENDDATQPSIRLFAVRKE